ncbi:MAG: hypothetical protein ABIS20_12315 [Thermoanaerobaculia bacterium]
MPKITARSKIFRDWEGLLGACDKNVSLLTGMEPLKTELEGFLARLREEKLTQENLDGTKKASTQQLEDIADQGAEVARKLRAFVLSRIGTKTELGKMFGLVPTGRKTRKSKASAKPLVAAAPPSPEQAQGDEA